MSSAEQGRGKGSRRQFLKTAAAGVGAVLGLPGAAQGIDFEQWMQATGQDPESFIEGMRGQSEMAVKVDLVPTGHELGVPRFVPA